MLQWRSSALATYKVDVSQENAAWFFDAPSDLSLVAASALNPTTLRRSPIISTRARSISVKLRDGEYTIDSRRTIGGSEIGLNWNAPEETNGCTEAAGMIVASLMRRTMAKIIVSEFTSSRGASRTSMRSAARSSNWRNPNSWARQDQGQIGDSFEGDLAGGKKPASSGGYSPQVVPTLKIELR